MEHLRDLPFVVTLDDCDTPADALDALLLGRFTAGREPAAHTVELSRVRPDAALLPPGVAPRWTAVDGHFVVFIATGDGWTLRVKRWKDGTATVTVTAIAAELARRIVEEAIHGAVAEPDDPSDQVVMVFWHRRDRAPKRVERDISVESWAAIARNYSAPARSAFESLGARRPDDLPARLVLLHGPPGTGKTSALRTLADTWREWCRFELVLDPERLLAEPGYLMDVAVGEPDDDAPLWRMLVLEDCDELIRAEAKRERGQALSRLLNLTDGLLGQGLNVLVALTTNEELGRLHPAIIRPGRCLAEIHVGPLSASEARAWLGPDAPPIDGPATLAELLRMRGSLDQLRPVTPPTPVGQYL